MVMQSVRRSAPSRVQKGGPSKLRGVIWHKSNGKWEARIYEAGKQRFLGYFTSEVAAAKAYDSRAVQLHGAGAKVNFPMDHPHIWPQAASTDRGCHLDRADSLKMHSILQRKHSLLTTPDPRKSLRGNLYHRSAKSEEEEESYSSDGGASDEASLERAAVEVLASLSSREEAASWRSSSLVQTHMQRDNYHLWDEPEDDKPTISTGTSPQPARKTREWTHPALWVRPNQEPAAPAESSCQLSGSSHLDDEAVASKPSAHHESPETPRVQRMLAFKECNTSSSEEDSCDASEAEAFTLSPSADASTPAKHRIEAPKTAPGAPIKKPNKMSSNYKGVSWNIVCRKWVAVIWDRQTKRARHIGTFENDVDAARAYDREALAMVNQGATLNFPEEVFNTAQDTAQLLRSNSEKVVPASTLRRLNFDQVAPPELLKPTSPPKLQTKDIPTSKTTRGSSRFRGVSWCEKGQKWRALLWDGSRQHFLGHFKEEEEGARAYDRALLRRKKKDGCLNFPITDYLDIVGERNASTHGTGSTSLYRAASAPQASVARSADTQNPHLTRPSRQSRRTAIPPARFRGTCTLSEDQGPSAEQSHLDSFPEEQMVETVSGDFSTLEAYVSTLDAASLTRASTARGSSRFKGVSWSGRSGKWRAQMWHGAKVLHLGFFDDELDAARAYDDAVAQYRGPAAPSNFVTEASWQASLPDSLDGKGMLDNSRLASTYRGVRWHDRNCKWEARIFDGQRQVSLGYYDEELAAAIAYDAAAVQLRGPQTSTNFLAQSSTQPRFGQGVLGASATWQEARDFQPCHALKRSSSSEDVNPLGIEWGKRRRRN